MESSDKETRAIFLNFKELRSLEKNVQALDLQKAYNISLINLDQKVIKVKYKHLKDKVSRIKSHLQPEHVEELKNLEEEGKLNIKIPESDLRLKITAAERRLKLMPRAKSAAPRLQNGSNTEKKSNIYKGIPRSGRKVQIGTATPQPKTPMSPRSPKENLANKPESARESDYLVPKSVREERKRSIDVRCLNDDLNAFKAVTIPTLNVVHDVENNDDDTDPLSQESHEDISQGKKGEFNALNSHKAVGTPVISLDALEINRNKSLEDTSHTRTEREMPLLDLSVNVSGRNTENQENFSRINTSNGTQITDKENAASAAVPTKTLEHSGVNECHNTVAFGELKKTSTSIIKDGWTSENETWKTASFLQVPSGNPAVKSATQTENKQVKSSKSKIRPMSVPATQITDFGKTPQKTRPKTAIEMAIETRKKSVMEIRRASTMLKEGKTRSPFTCHEKETNQKMDKPFRSIREGANTANNDNEIFDNTLGDDLHKEMKKGMILGEVASSLYLEDKIDHFLENVDKYVKENPNYVYDPEAAKQKKVPRTREKKARPKRNILRRRQLERQLHEGNIEEMKKSRWLRVEDDKLDTSGMTTLVVDQMKMLNKLRHPYDEYD